MIGNQLHANTAARTMALMIDEMFQKAFVNFLVSEKVDEFSQIGDELTDVGGMKALLTKLRFFENEWDLQEKVFRIFESSEIVRRWSRISPRTLSNSLLDTQVSLGRRLLEFSL